MVRFFKTVKSVYLLVNNPVTKFIVKNFFLLIGFVVKWFFIILVGPISWFVFKLSFKHAFTKTLPKMLKKYSLKANLVALRMWKLLEQSLLMV